MSKKLPSLHKINVRCLQRLVASGEVSISEALNDWHRLDIERYEEFGISKLQNIWGAHSTMPFETYQAWLARRELVVRGEWQYDDSSKATCSLATAGASAVLVAFASSRI